MKKVALSLLALALVGTSAFAADSAAGTTIPAPLTATIAANGYAQVGVDLDTGSYGFKNGTEAKITLDILNGTSEKGTEGVTGYIKIEDIKFRFDGNTGGKPTFGSASSADIAKAQATQATELAAAGTDEGKKAAANAKYNNAVYPINTNGAAVLTIGSVTAKLMLGDLYVKLTGNTDPAVDFAADGDDDNGGATIVADDAFYTYSGVYGADKAEWTTGKIGTFGGITGVGTEVGYTVPKVVSFVAGIATLGAWSNTDKDGQPAEGSLAVSLLAVDKLTLTVKGYAGNSSATNDLTKALGAEVAYDLGVVAPFLHLNAQADTTSALADGAYALDAGAKLPIVDGLKAVAVVKYDSAANVDFTLTTDLAKAKLAGPVGALVGLQLKSLTSDVKANKSTAVFVKVEADVADGVNVWGKTSFNSTAEDAKDSLYLKAGVDFSKLLPLTTFSLEYDSSDFGGKKAQGDQKLGQIFVQAKVAY